MNIFAFLSNPSFQSGLLHGIIFLPLPLIVLDWLSGMWSAARRGVFALSSVSDVLKGDVLKYIGGLTALGSVSQLFSLQLDANIVTFIGPAAVLSASIVASIFSNLEEVFAGNPVVVADLKAADTMIERDLSQMPQWVGASSPPPPMPPMPAPMQQQVQQTGTQSFSSLMPAPRF